MASHCIKIIKLYNCNKYAQGLPVFYAFTRDISDEKWGLIIDNLK